MTQPDVEVWPDSAVDRRVIDALWSAVGRYARDPLEPPAAESLTALIIALSDVLYRAWPASEPGSPDGFKLALIDRDPDIVTMTGCIVVLYASHVTPVGGMEHSGANGINDAGAVVGYVQTESGGDSRQKHEAVVWAPGSTEPTVLPRLDPAYGARANAINVHGVPVGWAYRVEQSTLVSNAVLWPPPQTTVQNLSSDGFRESDALDINAGGSVLISRPPRLWRNGVITGLTCLSGVGRNTLNDADVVVGDQRDAVPVTPARWKDGTCTPCRCCRATRRATRSLSTTPAWLWASPGRVTARGAPCSGRLRARWPIFRTSCRPTPVGSSKARSTSAMEGTSSASGS